MVSFKIWLETIIPIGDCFRFATNLANDMVQDGIFKDISVVHGTIHPKWHHRRYPHAWVEADGRTYDWQMHKTVGFLPIKDFYELNNPEDIKKYTPHKALANMVKNKHHGPW